METDFQTSYGKLFRNKQKKKNTEKANYNLRSITIFIVDYLFQVLRKVKKTKNQYL